MWNRRLKCFYSSLPSYELDGEFFSASANVAEKWIHSDTYMVSKCYKKKEEKLGRKGEYSTSAFA